MDHAFCPGARTLRQPKPEIIACPSCGAEVEMWSDEIRASCPKCDRTVMRENNVSCVEWCKMAEECVGTEAYQGYLRNKAATLRQRLLEELESFFGSDKKRIRHAQNVLGFAEKLLETETADWHIVIPASILHDVGIKAAEEKYGSAAGHYQEEEGPPIAREILKKLGCGREQVDEICEIIAHHHSPGVLTSLNFKVLYDADCIVNFRDVSWKKTKTNLERMIDETFLTDSGRKLAKSELLGRD